MRYWSLPLRHSKPRRCRWPIPPPPRRSRRARRRRRPKSVGIAITITITITIITGITTTTSKPCVSSNRPATRGPVFLYSAASPSAIAYDDDHVFARNRRALFRPNLWLAHSWRVQVAIASFKPKNTTAKRSHVERGELKATDAVAARPLFVAVRNQEGYQHDGEFTSRAFCVRPCAALARCGGVTVRIIGCRQPAR